MPASVRPKRRSRFRIQITALAFLMTFLLVELAGFNTGENLLYLLAAVTLALLLLGVALSFANLRGLQVVRHAPDSVHRDDPFHITITITNRKRFLPSFSFVLAFQREEWRPAAHVSTIPARSSVTLRVGRAMRRRGLHPLPPVVLKSGFPMGFFRRELIVDDGQEILVFPRIYRIQRSVLDRLDDSGNRPRPTLTPGDEFFALREYVPGDDIRHICWRVSARLGELIVRELEPGSVRSVAILLDTRGVPHSLEHEEQSERAIDLAASLSVAFLDRQYSVALITPEDSVPLGQGESHVLRVLRLLARVRPAEYAETGDDWARLSGDLSAAAKVYIATDPSQWGGHSLDGSVRVLDPQELLHAS
jgi:uncharacterized protein (DUF58 family)